jgi:hypothetical protein
MNNISTQLDPTLRSVESLEFDYALRSRVVGQAEAVRAVVDAFQVYCAEMRPGWKTCSKPSVPWPNRLGQNADRESDRAPRGLA